MYCFPVTILDTLGYPINGSSDRFIPFVNQAYKIALYENETDADNNTFASAVWVIDGVPIDGSTLSTELAASDGTSLITHTEFDTDYNLQTYLRDIGVIKKLCATFENVATMVAAKDLKIGQIVSTAGYYTAGDGGGNYYEVVASGTGTVDGGSYIDLTGSLLQAQGVFPDGVYINQFGARGLGLSSMTEDTAGIDATFAYIEADPSKDGSSENGARSIILRTDAIAILCRKGEYFYNGAGYTPIIEKVIILRGLSPDSTTINIQSDVHLIHPTDDSKVMVYVELSNIKIIGGRGAFFNEKNNLGAVGHGKRVYNCIFGGYTSVAFGSTQLSDARWVVKNTVFEGGDSGTPVGLYLPHEVAGMEVSGCNTFSGNKYDIICTNDGISEMVIGPTNNFFNISGRSKEADIWFQPGDSNQGLGVRLIGNRHSNENLDISDPNILIADRDGTTASHVFSHLLATSTNSFNGLTINQCTMNSVGNPDTSSGARGYILSYTPNVAGLRVVDNQLGQWRPCVIEYAGAITKEQVDAGGCVTNYARLTTSRKTPNIYDIIGMSNIDGAGLIEYDNMFAGGLPGGLQSYSDGTVDLVKLISSSDPNTYAKGGSVTATPLTDVGGGALATSFTFAADQTVVLPISHANIDQGRLIWLEADVKGTTATPLQAVNVQFTIRGKLVTYQIALTGYWQRIRIPLVSASGGHVTGTFGINFAPKLFLETGVADSFGLGRVALYHQQGPVEFSLTQAP